MELLKIERKVQSGWIQVKMSELLRGDEFRGFDKDGTPAWNGNAYIAVSDAYLDSQGTWAVKVDGVGDEAR